MCVRVCLCVHACSNHSLSFLVESKWWPNLFIVALIGSWATFLPWNHLDVSLGFGLYDSKWCSALLPACHHHSSVFFSVWLIEISDTMVWASGGALQGLLRYYWHSEGNEWSYWWDTIRLQQAVLNEWEESVFNLFSLILDWNLVLLCVFKGYDIWKVPQLNKWGEATSELSTILFIQLAKPHRTPPVELTASRLFVQLVAEDVSGPNKQMCSCSQCSRSVTHT